MIVEVAKIQNSGKEFELKFVPDEIDLESEYGKITGATEFAGVITYQNLRTTVAGKIATTVELNCLRCFKALPRDLNFEFRNAYILAEDYTKEEEAELEDLGLEISIFEGDTIDLKKVAAEQIALVLPAKVLCTEACRGLCEKCGENLNVRECQCAEDDVDPRWAALKDLKK